MLTGHQMVLRKQYKMNQKTFRKMFKSVQPVRKGTWLYEPIEAQVKNSWVVLIIPIANLLKKYSFNFGLSIQEIKNF